MPPASQIETQFMSARRLGLSVALNYEYSVEFFQQLLGSRAVQILQNAIIRQNLRLIMGKDHTEKKPALPGAIAIFANARRRRAAMVAIGDVKRRNPGELVFNYRHPAAIRNGP